jgi:long-chain acyl-CoA synthetase
MTSVPRILERVLALVTARSQENAFQSRLVPWAFDVGRRYMTAKERGGRIPLSLRLQYRIAHALVLRKLRRLLGLDRVKFLVSGSAALHFDTAMTYLAADIPIIEGYGPTECSPVIAVNRLEDNRYGTVGKAMPGVDVKLSDDGEILARGDNVMLGYYREPQATAEAIEDGWYKTGDVGEMDADGYLRITDRKKELFKTSGGKFIAPARVESAIKRSIYVAQAMVVGNSRQYPIVLISPDWQLVSRKLGLPAKSSTQELSQRSDVHSFMLREIRANSADLANFEHVRRIIILPKEFSIENGELSPTLKVRRRVVEERYAEEIERAYRTS